MTEELSKLNLPLDKKTDKFRIVPHSPYVYRIERLYIRKQGYTESKQIGVFLKTVSTVKTREVEVWKNYGSSLSNNFGDVYHNFQESLHGGKSFRRVVNEYESVEKAQRWIDYILSEERRRKEFMDQEIIYYGGSDD